jgi:adenosylcobinamide-phosphate synthase
VRNIVSKVQANGGAMQDFFIMLAVLIIAIMLDLTLGEPPWQSRIPLHPTVWISMFVKKIVSFFKNKNPKIEKFNGALLAILTISLATIPVFVILKIFQWLHILLYVVFAALILKLTLCIKLETKIADLAAKAVKENDLTQGRECAAMFSRRKVDDLNGQQVVSAVIESMAENLTDFKLSPIFYFGIFGVTGGVAFKTINVLDGAVGFKDKEHVNVGWFSAMLDTIANFITSRLTALFIVLASPFSGGNYKSAWKIMFRDRRKVPSINHGWPMAAMAGALNVTLEKPGYYIIGDKTEELSPEHVFRALKIRNAAIILFILLVEIPILLVTSYFFGLRI